MRLLCALLPILYATATEARGGRGGGKGHGGGGSGGSSLNLSPLDTATFVFFIIFAIATAGQLITALKQFKARQPGEDFARRVGFMTLISLTTCAILAAYSLSAYLVTQFSPTASGDPRTVFLIGVMSSFTRTISHVFFYAGILLVLDWRCQQQAAQYGHAMSKQFATIVRIVPPVLLFVMLISSVSRAAIGGSIYNLASRSSWPAYAPIYHVYLAMFVLATVAIIGTTIVLWTNRRPEESSYELVTFDERILKRIVYVVGPFITIQALYEVIYDIIQSIPAFSVNVTWSGLNLADILIQGIINFTLLYVATRFGLAPKQSNQKESQKLQAEIKGQEASPLYTGPQYTGSHYTESTYVNK